METFKRHFHSLQRDEVQDVVKSGEDVKEYLLNFFEHMSGNHSGCISDICKSPDYEQPYLNDAWVEQVQEIRNSFEKELKPYCIFIFDD